VRMACVYASSPAWLSKCGTVRIADGCKRIQYGRQDRSSTLRARAGWARDAVFANRRHWACKKFECALSDVMRKKRAREVHCTSTVRACVPTSKTRLFTSAPKPAVRECAYASLGDRAIAWRCRRTCKPYWVLLQRARLLRDDTERTEGVANIWEGNREHGRTAIFEGSNDATGGRYDVTVERSRKGFL
jgi:hypothetical protein